MPNYQFRMHKATVIEYAIMCYIDHTSSTASYVDITQIKYPPRGGGGGGIWSF